MDEQVSCLLTSLQVDQMTDSAVAEYSTTPCNIPGVFAWSHGYSSRIPRPFRVAPYWYAGIVIRREWSAQQEVVDVAVEIHGPAKQAFVYAPQARLEQIGLAIAPSWTQRLLSMRCDDIPNHNVEDIGASIKQELEPVVERASKGINSAEIINQILIYVRQKISDHPTPLCLAPRLFRIAKTQELDLSVRHVAASLDLSERQFRRKFIDDFGCTPKQYLRILRLQRVLEDIDTNAKPNWSSVAVTHGYSDQSHLIREFRTFMETTPLAAHAERKNGVSDLSNTGVQIFHK